MNIFPPPFSLLDSLFFHWKIKQWWIGGLMDHGRHLHNTNINPTDHQHYWLIWILDFPPFFLACWGKLACRECAGKMGLFHLKGNTGWHNAAKCGVNIYFFCFCSWFYFSVFVSLYSWCSVVCSWWPHDSELKTIEPRKINGDKTKKNFTPSFQTEIKPRILKYFNLLVLKVD